MRINESWHFVPGECIPVIDASTPLLQVYQRLYAGGHGGFLMDKGNRADSYVKAYELADSILAAMQNNPEKIRDITNKPIGKVIAKLSGNTSNVFVPVDPNAVDADYDESALRFQPERIFRVMAFGQPAGWFLNHETVRGTVTRRVVFLCANDPPHRNADPDHGTCYSCPKLIKTAILE
jgi:hypothetical protein